MSEMPENLTEKEENQMTEPLCQSCSGSGFTCSCGDERRVPCQASHRAVVCADCKQQAEPLDLDALRAAAEAVIFSERRRAEHGGYFPINLITVAQADAVLALCDALREAQERAEAAEQGNQIWAGEGEAISEQLAQAGFRGMPLSPAVEQLRLRCEAAEQENAALREALEAVRYRLQARLKYQGKDNLYDAAVVEIIDPALAGRRIRRLRTGWYEKGA